MKEAQEKAYTVEDVKRAEITLESLQCVKCGDKENVTYMQYIGDAHCANCDTWQADHIELEINKNKLIG